MLAGRYRLGDTIGRGGMGKVWRAHDEVLHRTVAVKELTAALYVAEADRVVLHARTQKEARAAARITHPGVVTVHDVLDHDNRPWIVMQYVDGPSLADAVKASETGRIEAREAARIGLHVLGALRAAHAAGVLHRDVKPGNVLLARDARVLLTDFGIAAIEGDSTITRTGELVGSIDYLAPERVRGGQPGPASDLWSLGATLYTAVQGESPFRRSSPISTMQAVVNEEPPPATHAGALAPVITALLRKDPDDRPSAEEAERMFLEAMEGREPRAAHEYVPTRQVSEAELHAANGPAGGSGTVRTPAPAPAPEAVVPAPSVASARPAGRRRWRTVALVVALAAVVGGGVGLAVLKYRDSGTGTTTTGGTASKSPDKSPDKDKPVKQGDASLPDGWKRVKDPAGFTLFVPEGWRRQMDGKEVDYTPDDGRHYIRISVGKPDFENPYMHQLNLEKALEKRLPKYQRITLHSNTFRDQVNSSLWEFTYVEKKGFPGKRHAIDQMYFSEDGGTEYAVYMSGPESDWATTREQFDTVLRGWQPPPQN
ncbi:serine/threonine-protein kinase [Streptomyces sp. NPDC020719]|uniref:serine/threonine-protein kinase n=1 Tax=unclassified Streptomyces TaxID=2593676 RepID=UPI0033C445AB